MVKNYGFVGITEQFDDVITVLEKLIPSFFDGLSEKWSDLG